MRESNTERYGALAGVIAIVLLVVGFMIAGESPGTDESTREIVDYWENDVSAVSVVLEGLAALALICFGSVLTQAFRGGEGRSWLTVLPLVGATIVAIGFMFDATIALTLTEEADNLSGESVRTLNALFENDFVPMGAGMALLLLSSGVLIVSRRTNVPKWLGWVAIALFVVSPTPIGFVGFVGGGLWIAVLSILLTMRGTATPAEPTQETATA